MVIPFAVPSLEDIEEDALAVVEEVRSNFEDRKRPIDWSRLAEFAELALEADLKAKGKDFYQLTLWKAVTHELHRRATKTLGATSA